MADALYLAGTQVGLGDPVSAPSGGYGTVYVAGLDWGAPGRELFMDPRPLGDGVAFRGQVAKDRRLTMILVGDAGSLAKAQDTWQAVADLIRAASGPVSLRYDRTDGAAASTSRELLVVPVDPPSWSHARGGEPGIKPSGTWVMPLTFIAPFPWWRNYTETTTTLNPSGTTPANSAITRGGKLVCGMSIAIPTAGTLGSILISDGSRSMTATATFGGTPKTIDWYYTDPGSTGAIPSGVTLSVPAHVSMHSATTTITVTPGIGSSGNHTVTIKHKPLWEHP